MREAPVTTETWKAEVARILAEATPRTREWLPFEDEIMTRVYPVTGASKALRDLLKRSRASIASHARTLDLHYHGSKEQRQ